jgi:hypothetical protein
MADLLSAIRTHYVKQLAEVVRKAPGHVEPAFRLADGALALEGALQLPGRADFIPTDGPNTGEPRSVDADSRLTFDPIEVTHLSCTITLEPFTWDWATVLVNGITVDNMATMVGDWFYRWFDPEDAKTADADGLFAVVHFASDPVAREGGVETTLDLGSAPVDAFQDILKMLAEGGATQIRVF